MYGAVYVKGNLHFDPFYDGGVLQPEEDAVYEWFFEKDKVSFLAPRWRFVLDKKNQHMLAVNLNEKFYVKISLPMNLQSYVDQQLLENLKKYQINGTVKTTKQTKVSLGKKCDHYVVSEWIAFQDQRFYVRERTLLATTEVPFDWKLLNELYAWIRSFFKPQETYKNELNKINGFMMAGDDIRFQEGDQVKYKFKIQEIIEKKIPKSVFEIPPDFKEKDKFTRSELIDIRTTYYFYYR
jgi:hypothetical protein